MKIDTESQRIVLELIQYQIQKVIDSLIEKKEQLELRPDNDEASEVIMLRLDTLLKVSKYLISPLHDTYSFIDKGNDVMEMGDLKVMVDEMEKNLRLSLHQGL